MHMQTYAVKLARASYQRKKRIITQADNIMKKLDQPELLRAVLTDLIKSDDTRALICQLLDAE